MNRFLSCIAAVLLATPLFAQNERILLPVFTSPVLGAFGSEFHTDLRILNIGQEEVRIFGLQEECIVTCIPTLPQLDLPAGEEAGPGLLAMNGHPGRFIEVDADDVDSLSMNLRVHDVSRSALNFGTEMPIVREREFKLNQTVLVGVPTDARFRNTLRVYTTFPAELLLTVGNRPPVPIQLTGREDEYDPAYAVYTDFPVDAGTIRVKVEVDPSIVTLLPIEVPIWAFITVTNNDTQAITTITPQP